ncbi:hypothetical protein BJX68DRAFT_269602 [Aspergillus pseudodeflectus]|uniref:F-box domain-containing protein n=1 Tax=Aspergillus pseudodeflectus TaxID=176178 RepID=A0ABR4JXJ7_9EURO
MLTPIRVRGRRKRAWSPSDGVPKPVPSGPKGGRPMLPPKSQGPVKSNGRKQPRLLVARPPPRKPRNKLSRLEALPVELIEKIFLYSLNVNLPRSSRFLAQAMSSERIYRALTLLAFWDDASLTPAESDTDQVPARAKAAQRQIFRLLRPFDYCPLTLEERLSFQESVLRCRWCTLERVVDQLPDLMRLTILRHWVSKPFNMASDEQEKLDLFLAQKGDDRTFEGTDKDEVGHTLSIVPLAKVTIIRSEPYLTWNVPVLGILKIPDKYLSGTGEGFSEAHTRYLELLRVAGGITDAVSKWRRINPSFSREALQEGVHTALIAHNTAALTTLLKIDELTFRLEEVAPPLPYTFPAEHFRTAVRVARHDPGFFQLLLRASAESVPIDDSEITQWAMELDGPFGAWLLDFMLELPQRVKAVGTDPEGGAMFYKGRSNAQCPMTTRYLREVLGVEAVEKWTDETPCDGPGNWAVEA